MRKEQLTWSTSTSAEHLVLSCAAPLSLSRRGMDLTDGHSVGEEFARWHCGHWLHVQVETSYKWCCSEVRVGTSIDTFAGGMDRRTKGILRKFRHHWAVRWGHSLEGRDASLRDLDRLEGWSPARSSARSCTWVRWSQAQGQAVQWINWLRPALSTKGWGRIWPNRDTASRDIPNIPLLWRQAETWDVHNFSGQFVQVSPHYHKWKVYS